MASRVTVEGDAPLEGLHVSMRRMSRGVPSMAQMARDVVLLGKARDFHPGAADKKAREKRDFESPIHAVLAEEYAETRGKPERYSKDGLHKWLHDQGEALGDGWRHDFEGDVEAGRFLKMDFRSETVQGISELRAGDKWEKDLETLFSRLGEREYHTRTKHVASRGGPCTWQWSCTPSSTSPTRTPTRGTRDPLVTRAPGTRAPPGTRARGGGWTERRPASARGGSARTPRPSLPRGTTRAGARGARRIPPAPLGPLGARGRGRHAAAGPVGAGAPGGMPGPAGPVGTSAPGRARPRARGVPRPPRRVVRPRISAVGVAAPALGRVARRGSAETVRDFGGCPSPRGRCAGTPQTRSRDPGWGNI